MSAALGGGFGEVPIEAAMLGVLLLALGAALTESVGRKDRP